MRLFCVMLASALVIECAFAQGHPAPFSLSLSADRTEVTAADEVVIKVRMTNTSDHDLNCSSMYAGGVDNAYQYLVKDAEGKPVGKRNRPHPEIGDAGSIVLCTLKPGESVTRENRLSRLLDLSHPGKYVIQVARKAGDSEGKGTVTSNKLILTVAP
jgi:hypothetical protein